MMGAQILMVVGNPPPHFLGVHIGGGPILSRGTGGTEVPGPRWPLARTEIVKKYLLTISMKNITTYQNNNFKLQDKSPRTITCKNYIKCVYWLIIGKLMNFCDHKK